MIRILDFLDWFFKPDFNYLKGLYRIIKQRYNNSTSLNIKPIIKFGYRGDDYMYDRVSMVVKYEKL